MRGAQRREPAIRATGLSHGNNFELNLLGTGGMPGSGTVPCGNAICGSGTGLNGLMIPSAELPDS